MSEQGETCEVVAISGVFQKADGKPFTDERAQLFIDGLLKWVRDEGFSYGGTYGHIHNDEEHEAFTHHERHRANHNTTRQRDLAVRALERSAEWQIACLRSNAYTPSVDRDEAAAVWRECAQALAAIGAIQPENASKEIGHG